MARNTHTSPSGQDNSLAHIHGPENEEQNNADPRQNALPALTRTSYTMAWICTRRIEMSAAIAALDSQHQPLAQSFSDPNIYTLGSIQKKNIVIAMTDPFTVTLITTMFPALTVSIVMGIGSGVPVGTGIRLGDAVINTPLLPRGGAVRDDYDRAVRSGELHHHHHHHQPSNVLLTALAQFERDQTLLRSRVSGNLAQIQETCAEFAHPGPEYDFLFQSEYEHTGGDCEAGCDMGYLIPREEGGEGRLNASPTVHRGLILYWDGGMRNGVARDRMVENVNTIRGAMGWADDRKVLCFDSGAAGLMHHLPSLVVRGISDYADSHASPRWQAYAAAVAAAVARDLVRHVLATEDLLVDGEDEREEGHGN
ncbi:hypothetical protein BO78DRAFT_466419 [Aspergillus sclerotiicarbonarius CBS 121057]|uniref:Purine and uridine phosphorylase n=1 Tax=Aspergillus sclerotiicarbonarius (strain CBS 121057 / IBT 28362) TaxID=1448318 RepID=A0A319ELW2_ASPSB|nr:hypothetical protein BO78DRAFT_466419 [Aspergillus sclerotiicarbonarius CBS 121057]